MLKNILIAVLGLLAIAALWSWWQSSRPDTGIACTQEAKLCPDGSYVGRVGPSCEFAPCPGATTTPPASGGIAPYDSGIEGMVLLGPTCPVERIPPDPACADKPYATLVAVFRKADAVHAVALVESAADGAFSVSLPPGDYVLGAGESTLPRCDHPDAHVVPGAYASVTISCDTGIR